jgi:hypothetical protein
VLIPSLYATSPRTRSLGPIRVPSDQNTRWRLPFHFSLIKDKNFLSLHICQIDIHYLHFQIKWNFHRDAAHVRQEVNRNPKRGTSFHTWTAKGNHEKRTFNNTQTKLVLSQYKQTREGSQGPQQL